MGLFADLISPFAQCILNKYFPKNFINFTCIVIDLFLNNQPDALIIPILFCYKTLNVSGIFSAYHQEFSTVHSSLVSFMQVSDDRFQADSECHPDSTWKRSSEICMKLNSAECTVENF
jgi:hypothetical protein